jgi:mono/diheme cytochrome c family protein
MRTIQVAIVLALLASMASAQSPRTDPAAVERGRPLFVAQCGFCHGPNARGGANGPDLTRSVVVQEDEAGKQLGEFVRTGRPDRGMPKFDLGDAQMSDIAAFLHGEIRAAADRNAYKILDILVGDAKAGEAFFKGAGACIRCHAVDGDLKGIGSQYEPESLQGKLLLPRERKPAPDRPSIPL